MTTKRDDRPPPGNEREIHTFFHCALCVAGGNGSDIEAGFTPLGIQVWCRRHDANMVHVDFEGMTHPANTTRKRPKPRLV